MASGMLSVAHIGGLALPGCGGGSDCAKAAASTWGSIPGIQWPVSFLGAAYFGGLLIAWLMTRGAFPSLLKWVVRLGAVVSILYLGIMFGEKLMCAYCLTSHLANLAFVGLSERWAPARASTPGRAPVIAGITFAAVSVVLGFAEGQTKDRAKAAYDDSVKKMIAGAGQPAATGPTGVSAPAAPTGQPAATGAPAPKPPVPAQPAGFTGRYLAGPQRAPIRVVMITDYQCPDCKNLEGQMRTIMAQNPNVSLSIKHFPFCTSCNATPNVPNMHPNACWAARAAETAGILYGSDGFWKMHHWLFDQGGSFTDQTFPPALAQLGFDAQRFTAVMQSPETLSLVQADIAEAVKLGLLRTPMVFINGVELKNWNVMADALPKAIAALAAANPAPAGPESDRPPRAADKAVADWREATAMAWASRKQAWTIVPESAPVRVMLFGDFLEPGTAQADKIIREAIAGRSDIRYEFRYYPIDQTCNSYVPRTMFANACRATAAAEAAGQIGGIDAYWRMHEWLMTHQADVVQGGDAAIRAAAPSLGLDPANLMAAMETSDVQQVLANEYNLASRIGMPEIPRIYVNFKPVSRWNLPNEFILERVIEEAGRPKATPAK